MKRFIKWLFNIKDEPQGLYEDQWVSMRRRLLRHDLEKADRAWAEAKQKLDNCKPTDARRGVYSKQLQKAKTQSLEIEIELEALERRTAPCQEA